MSADNMICIQKRIDQWWVWMDSASNDEKYPDWSDVAFETEIEAVRYAWGWLRGESVVEYGVVVLDPQVDPVSNEEKRIELIDKLVYVIDDMGLKLTRERIKKAKGLLKKLKGLVEED